VQRIAILGLGRMGTALRDRFLALGRDVTGWTRSGGGAPEAAVEGAPSDVLAPLQSYMQGHATGDPAHFRRAFLPSAHVEGIRDGEFVSWSLDEYCGLFSGSPAHDEASRTRRIDRVDVEGTVATATMTLRHGPDTFTDAFLLAQVDGAWRIANKAYHKHC
jgi:hypothetical protein